MSSNGSNYNPKAGGVAGSMFGPKDSKELDAKLSETVTMTRGKLADMIHEGVMEIGVKMAEEYDILDKSVASLETTNAELRREITGLKGLLKDAKVFEAS